LSDLGYRTGIAGKIHASPEEVFPFIKVEGMERNCVSTTAKYDSKGISQFINLEKDQPFCLIIALVVPHIHWTVGDIFHFNPDRLKLPPYLADTPETRENYAKYLAEIEALDQQVGMTLEVLEESGMANNTIVIFTSEQGAQFPGCKPMLPCTITYGATSWSQATEELLTEKDEGQPLYADSAYTGEEQEKAYKKKKVINKVIEKGYSNKPLSEKQKASNKDEVRDTSTGRAFIWLCGKQHEWFICANHRTGKSQGENRNDSPCGINTSLSNRVNLNYNICRCVQLKLVVAME